MLCLFRGRERRKYLEENLPALKIKLTPEYLTRIDEVAPNPKGAVAGTRYPETMMRVLNG